MTISELKVKLEEARFKMKKARDTGIMVKQQKESLRNVLENYLDEIIAAIESAEAKDKKVAALDAALESSDEELDAAEKKIAELESRIAELEGTQPKKKKAGTDAGGQ